MRCDAFERWLDDGMPDALAAAARAHARDCAACATSLRLADSIEASLRAAPPGAPAGFTASVIARIEALERPAPAPAVFAAPWWVVVGSEPALWVGAGLVAALVAAGNSMPRLSAALAGVAEAGASAWVTAASLWLSRIPALLPSLDPTERSALALGLALPLLWALYRAPIWMAESWSRRGRAAPRGRDPIE